jgi:hypothetical protein
MVWSKETVYKISWREGNKKIDQTKNEKMRVLLYIYKKWFVNFLKSVTLCFQKLADCFAFMKKNIWDKNNQKIGLGKQLGSFLLFKSPKTKHSIFKCM